MRGEKSNFGKVPFINFKVNKRGQFFLLAAVIISVIVISLGVSTNRVIVRSNDFQDVEDFSYEVEREIGEVLNYEIYTGINEGKVEEFAKLMAEDIRDKDSNTEFIFIFGNNEGMTVANYGEEDVSVVVGDIKEMVYCKYDDNDWFEDEVEREKCVNDEYNDDNCYACVDSCPDPYVNMSICSDINIVEASGAIRFSCTMMNGVEVCDPIPASEWSDDVGIEKISSEELVGQDEISVDIDGVDVVVPVSEHKQVYLIIKKESDNETYIAHA
ncbi:hypothetical protein KAS08_00860 [Candidatus Pacearchaeota archaeon]|nr:hypothetical protein [Candidatus Pacearchaeota archaeon]